MVGFPSRTPSPVWVDVCGPTDWISPSSLRVHHHGWDLSLTLQHGGPVLTTVESMKLPQGGGDSTCKARGLTHRRGWVTDSFPSGDHYSDPRTLFTALQPSPAKPSVETESQSRSACSGAEGLGCPQASQLGSRSHKAAQSPAPVTIEGAVGAGLLTWGEKSKRGWRLVYKALERLCGQESRSGTEEYGPGARGKIWISPENRLFPSRAQRD